VGPTLEEPARPVEEHMQVDSLKWTPKIGQVAKRESRS
jgi:hypothetical protein